MTPTPTRSLHEAVAEELDGVRRRSLDLLAPLSDEDQLAQHSPLMSPLVWDLAHVGHYEELWLLRAVARGWARSEYTHTVVLCSSFWLQSISTLPPRRLLVMRETTSSG